MRCWFPCKQRWPVSPPLRSGTRRYSLCYRRRAVLPPVAHGIRKIQRYQGVLRRCGYALFLRSQMSREGFSAWADAQRPNPPTVITTAQNSAGAEPCYGWPQDTIEWWCDLGSDEENISENLHPSGEFMSAVYPTVRGMTFDHPINDSDKPVHSRDGHIHPWIWAGKHPRSTAGQHPRLRK